MVKHPQDIEASFLDKAGWLANQTFSALPQEVSGLKFYLLDCGCIYYQRIFPDGTSDPKTGIYRDAKDGPCEICMLQDWNWKDRVIDEALIYASEFGAKSNP